VAALRSLGRPIRDLATYKSLVNDLYFIFKESIGPRLDGQLPLSFSDVNLLRTDLQHDLDHGEKGKEKAKKKKVGSVFKKYAGEASPQILDPSRFVLVQINLLSALQIDLDNMMVLRA
jgi:hypothetical protein